jgi:hypothetical protein
MRVENMRNSEFMILGSMLVLLGIVFGQDRLIGYSFIGAGVLLSIISSFKSRRKPGTKSHRAGDV